MSNLGARSQQERIVLWVIGWVVVIAVGAGLFGFGYAVGRRRASTAQPSPTATLVAVVPTVVGPTSASVIPTITPLPEASPTVAATNTPSPPTIAAGQNGLNIRSGPGTNYTRVGRVDPGTQFVVTGRYGSGDTLWWQIDYQGQAAWAYSGVVTKVTNFTEADVPMVNNPPPSPTPIPATPVPTNTPQPTAVPATPTPDMRGIVVKEFIVGHWSESGVKSSSGPFGDPQDIWYEWDITNTGGGVTFRWLGCWVEENGYFKKAWGWAGPVKLGGGERLSDRDHLEAGSLSYGTYHLYLRMCFDDGQCINLAGPREVTIPTM